MAREEKAGRAGGLRGKAETAGGELCLDLGLSQARDERTTLQAFFQSPGRFFGGAGLDNEKARRVEAGAQKARAVRPPPFLACGSRQAPQHEPAMCLHGFGDHRQDEAKGRRRIAIGMRLDLVEAALLEGA